MSRPRFVVQTVTGFPFHKHLRSGAGAWAPPGISAHVCDTVYLHEVVASYRSEDYAPIPGHRQRRRGADGAVRAAQEHAERLNRDTA